MSRWQNHAVYALVALAGAVAFGTIALNRDETVYALWVVIAAVATYLIAFRYHNRVLTASISRLPRISNIRQARRDMNMGAPVFG